MTVTIKTARSHTAKNDPYAYTEMLFRKVRPEEDSLDYLDIASLMSHTVVRVDLKLIGEKKAVPLSLFHILTEAWHSKAGRYPMQISQG